VVLFRPSLSLSLPWEMLWQFGSIMSQENNTAIISVFRLLSRPMIKTGVEPSAPMNFVPASRILVCTWMVKYVHNCFRLLEIIGTRRWWKSSWKITELLNMATGKSTCYVLLPPGIYLEFCIPVHREQMGWIIFWWHGALRGVLSNIQYGCQADILKIGHSHSRP
jgi:hypothetical protein